MNQNNEITSSQISDNKITISELEELMIACGGTIRAIPKDVRGVYSIYAHQQGCINGGKIEYIPEYGREMYVTHTKPIHGGQFVFESVKSTRSIVDFTGKQFYNSIEELAKDMKESLKSANKNMERYKEDVQERD